MCRLFACLSLREQNPAWPFINAPRSLLAQSHRNPKRKQPDGWGIGWFEKDQPRIFKSPRALFRDRRSLTAACRAAHGSTLVGHIRSASNPTGLSKHQLIGKKHTQPFRQGPWIFAHNGTLNIPKEVKVHLGPWASFVKGNNDSEVLFYWILKTVATKKGRPDRLVKRSLDRLDKIWKSCREKYPKLTHPFYGLNWVLTDGEMLLSFCYEKPEGFGPARANLAKRQPAFQLQFYRDKDSVWVASEPLTAKNKWRPFKHGQLLMARRGRESIRCIFRDADVGSSFPAGAILPKS